MEKADKQMKLFISQPMRGKTEEEILKVRADVLEKVKEQYPDIKLISSFIKNGDKLNPVDALLKNIKMMKSADVIYFVRGWTTASGCLIENLVANRYLAPNARIIEEL